MEIRNKFIVLTLNTKKQFENWGTHDQHHFQLPYRLFMPP